MASKFGVSANPKKANHILGKDKVVVVAVQNHNDYICGPNLIPQQKLQENGLRSKRIHRTNSTQVRNGTMSSSIKESLDNKKGTYRFKVDVERYDKHGNHVETIGTFYTNEFYIK